MPRTARQISSLLLLAALSCGVAACGGDDNGDEASDVSTDDSKADSRALSRLDAADSRAEAGDTEADDTEADDTETDAADDTDDTETDDADTDATDDTDAADTSDDELGLDDLFGDEEYTFEGDEDSDFCKKARELDEQDELNVEEEDDAKAAEEAFTELAKVAPDEIEDDLDIMKKLIPKLAELDAAEDTEDPSAGLGQVGEALELVFNPVNMRAMARVGAYLEQVCGVETDTSSGSAGTGGFDDIETENDLDSSAA